MINVYEKDGVIYAECDIDYLNKAVVNSSEPDFLTVGWKSDGHMVFKMHYNRLGIEYSVLHDRLTQFISNEKYRPL